MRGANKRRFPCFAVYQSEVTSLGHGIDIAVVVGAERHVEAVAEIHLLPVAVLDTTLLPDVAGAYKRAIILEAACHVVGDIHIKIDVIELAYGDIF